MDYEVWLHSSTGRTSALTAAEVMITRTPLIILVWVAVIPAAKEHVLRNIKVAAQILNLENNVSFTVNAIFMAPTALKITKKPKERRK